MNCQRLFQRRQFAWTVKAYSREVNLHGLSKPISEEIICMGCQSLFQKRIRMDCQSLFQRRQFARTVKTYSRGDNLQELSKPIPEETIRIGVQSQFLLR